MNERKPIMVEGKIVDLTFEETYEQFEKFMYSIVWKMCKGDPEFEDILQVARLSIWQAYLKYDASKGFAFTTFSGNLIKLKILCVWRTRRKKQERYHIVSIDNTVLGGNITFNDVIPAQLPNTDAILDVRKTLSHMNRRKRECLVANFAGYNQSEIGKRLGVSQSYASKLIKSAKAQFRELYTQ